jgi:hypothetical protein
MRTFCTLPLAPQLVSARRGRWARGAHGRSLRLGGLGAVLPVLLLPGWAAAGSDGDGAYGRLSGDLGFALDVGVSETFPGESLASRLATSYLSSAGVYVQYNDSLGLQAQPTARSMAAGVELRPLFLIRFGSDLEQGPACLDLLIDSLGIGVGTYGVALPAQDCSESGLGCWRAGFELGTGIELPLLPHADGPFIALRYAWRWPVSPRVAEPTAIDAPRGMLSLGLGYRVLVSSHLVDPEDAP